MIIISVIIPIHNGEKWIDRCFESIINQQNINLSNIEVCVCNDASSDNTEIYLLKWDLIFKKYGIKLLIYKNNSKIPCGVGFSKNRAVEISNGVYLCFQDVDDVMLPNRIFSQYSLARKLTDIYIVGCQFKREPANSTPRFTSWCNGLNENELNEQIYTANGPTIIMPTWFMHKEVFNRVGGFSEERRGTPEDLIFFYKHLDSKGKIVRVNEVLLVYQYHRDATTFSIKEDTIWDLRIRRLEERVLSNWLSFTIWNAGKQGRKFYNSLSEENKAKVVAFCDVDAKKIGKYYEHYDSHTKSVDCRVPIVHFQNATKPFVICMKTNLTDGEFEQNLNLLKLNESTDYVLFS